MKKFVLGTVVFASILFLALSVSAWSWPWEKDVRNSPSLKGTGVVNDPTEISANDCNADEVCEANTIYSNEVSTTALQVRTGTAAPYLLQLYAAYSDQTYGSSLGIIGAGLPFNIKNDNVIRILSNSVEIGTTEDSSVLFNSEDVVFDKLTGNGDAYACLDANGRLFRSATPCA